MQLHIPYIYKLRAAYNSDELLFEFPNVPDKVSFIRTLTEALQPLHPIMSDMIDLWMNDEVLFIITTDKGCIKVSVDVWEIGFIMSEDEECILAIDKLLIAHQAFQKRTEEV